MEFSFPPYIAGLIKKFEEANFEIYIVGGAVRDLLMRRTVKDWDFTTNATPDEMLKLFPNAFYNNAFGTVGVPSEALAKLGITIEKDVVLEVTTYRSEGEYSDKRHPDKVSWGKTLKEDLERRDFTINAIAIKVTRNTNQDTRKKGNELPPASYASLIDPFGGQNDLDKKLIRAVGNPNERFQEDALRMARAVRIAAELGFTIEEQTFEAIRKNTELIEHVSAERIRDEVLKLLASPFPYEGILILKSSELLRKILPEVEIAFDVPQKSPKRHHVVDVGTHLLLSLRYCPSRDPLVRLGALLHDVGKPETFKKDPRTDIITFYNHEVVGGRIVREIAKRLKLSKKQGDKLWILVRWHLFTVDERQTDSAIRRFIRNVGRENLEDILNVRTGDRMGGGATETSWRLELFKKRLAQVQKQPFSVQDLKINGYDVMKELGIPSGPKVGEILSALFAKVEEEKLKNNKAMLIKRMKDLVKS